ncbi:MAG: hypothetical protein CBD97_03140 [Pelagibacteraceae bacterium TMED237]|nr:MAG: hypothetical protein CBD97_03140 [Pelagibacteraceae bacterium TMED237]|tara:strand:- start:4377 stop:4607 length:231 start_codon:yes stop_codon:yes gene_type:complete
MNLDFFLMGGYGLYVWSAFIFAFIVCLILFFKTKKSLNKIEKNFKEEVEKLSAEQVETLNSRKISKEILTSQPKAK